MRRLHFVRAPIQVGTAEADHIVPECHRFKTFLECSSGMNLESRFCRYVHEPALASGPGLPRRGRRALPQERFRRAKEDQRAGSPTTARACT